MANLKWQSSASRQNAAIHLRGGQGLTALSWTSHLCENMKVKDYMKLSK
jgi:hypothetical protein